MRFSCLRSVAFSFLFRVCTTFILCDILRHFRRFPISLSRRSRKEHLKNPIFRYLSTKKMTNTEISCKTRRCTFPVIDLSVLTAYTLLSQKSRFAITN